MPPSEQVLVVPRKVFDGVGAFQGVCLEVESYRSAFFAPGVSRFVARSEAESDPEFKQLIPYVVMVCDGRVLSYVRGRRAGETRLAGRRSVGIGGHINPEDDRPLISRDPWETYLSAAWREVNEEVGVPGGSRDRVVALINDDSTEVGRVHLGIVHYCELERPDVVRREQMITQLTFQTVEELRADRDSLETWSQMVIDRFEAIAAAADRG